MSRAAAQKRPAATTLSLAPARPSDVSAWRRRRRLRAGAERPRLPTGRGPFAPSRSFPNPLTFPTPSTAPSPRISTTVKTSHDPLNTFLRPTRAYSFSHTVPAPRPLCNLPRALMPLFPPVSSSPAVHVPPDRLTCPLSFASLPPSCTSRSLSIIHAPATTAPSRPHPCPSRPPPPAHLIARLHTTHTRPLHPPSSTLHTRSRPPRPSPHPCPAMRCATPDPLVREKTFMHRPPLPPPVSSPCARARPALASEASWPASPRPRRLTRRRRC